jgi:hypothetical protein
MAAQSHPRLADLVSAEVDRLSGGAPVAALTRAGVVTLFAAVGNEVRRLSIEAGVSRLPGVRGVRNYLHIAGA